MTFTPPRCPDCKGEGHDPYGAHCEACNGHGKLLFVRCSRCGKVFHERDTDLWCPCEGDWERNHVEGPERPGFLVYDPSPDLSLGRGPLRLSELVWGYDEERTLPAYRALMFQWATGVRVRPAGKVAEGPPNRVTSYVVNVLLSRGQGTPFRDPVYDLVDQALLEGELSSREGAR